MSRKIAPLAAALLTAILVLAGCAAEPATDASMPPSGSPTPTEGITAPEKATPAVQDETCDWEAPRLGTGPAEAPSGQSGDFATVLIGAWQHTHFDTGSGYEALETTTDIRYVFPSTSRMLYCQDVVDATHQAENAVDISLDGLEIVLPSPATGYGAVAWDADTMVWKNNRDGSLYLLKRR